MTRDCVDFQSDSTKAREHTLYEFNVETQVKSSFMAWDLSIFNQRFHEHLKRIWILPWRLEDSINPDWVLLVDCAPFRASLLIFCLVFPSAAETGVLACSYDYSFVYFSSKPN
jgi:hypothetical protein